MYPLDAKTIVIINMDNGLQIQARLIDFHPMHPLLDHSLQSLVNHGHHSNFQRARAWRPPPREITATKPDPNPSLLHSSTPNLLDGRKPTTPNWISSKSWILLTRCHTILFQRMPAWSFCRLSTNINDRPTAPCLRANLVVHYAVIGFSNASNMTSVIRNIAIYAENTTRSMAVMAVAKHHYQPLRHINVFSTAERYDHPTPNVCETRFSLLRKVYWRNPYFWTAFPKYLLVKDIMKHVYKSYTSIP